MFPKVPRQRCVVHVQRECLSQITLHPRTPEGKSLKSLVIGLANVKTANDRLWWEKLFENWREENEEWVCAKGTLESSHQTYFLHNDLRKAFVHLKRALPNLFQYIDHPDLPKTTNAIEAFFGHIKDQLRIHRGLSEARVDNFLHWYLFFNDEKKFKD